MTVTERILTIAVVVLGTVTTRFLPFAIFPEGKKLPDAIVRLGRVLPAAVMGFLVIYCLRGSSPPLETEYGAELDCRHRAAHGFGAVVLCVICPPLSRLSPCDRIAFRKEICYHMDG